MVDRLEAEWLTGRRIDVREGEDLVLFGFESLFDLLLRDSGADGCLHLIDLRAVCLEADGDGGSLVRCG